MNNKIVSNDNGEVMLKLSGRLDTATSMQTSNDIDELLNTAGTIQRLTIDAGELEYIASSGLRILLKLKRRIDGELVVVHVSPAVNEILSATGFSKILDVHPADPDAEVGDWASGSGKIEVFVDV